MWENEDVPENLLFAAASQSWFMLYPPALLSRAGILTTVSGVNFIVVIAMSWRNQQPWQSRFEGYSKSSISARISISNSGSRAIDSPTGVRARRITASRKCAGARSIVQRS